ncbi:Hsp90 co-chaperone Cdc37 [Leucoagaricus sp. SymC.cos]|nr:Hsp90 co-chaperone Cdc37 [Leucoagaricus sp. SymC.cos]
MPLNYSKWDQLEVSDDSDIEGHPNVDHKSLVRWRQRDIHEKREARKIKITQLQANINCDNVLLPRVTTISSKLADPSTDPISYFNSQVEKLEKDPSKDCPPGNDPSKPEQTYDGMLLILLRGVTDVVKKRVQASNVAESEKDAKLGKELATEMAMHAEQLKKSIDDKKRELEQELKEQNKKITSEDIHDGFDSKYVPPKPEPKPVSVSKPKKSKKVKEATYEVLNPGASSPAPVPEPSPEPEGKYDEEETELPELTPVLEGFSKIVVGDYQKSWEYIQAHRDVYVDGASDALLVAAFTAEGEGKKKYAKQCVHQSLLLQYCEKLGRDGPRMFFRKMTAGDKRAIDIFRNDFENTYKHLVSRVKATKAEAAAAQEQIQLVAEDPSTTINFNVPEGPPPENLALEGPGTENLNVEEVRKALQMQWDIFKGFPEDLQEALGSNKLEEVNKVLGNMDVPTAESIVQRLNIAGILSFSDDNIRDQTSGGAAASA